MGEHVRAVLAGEAGKIVPFAGPQASGTLAQFQIKIGLSLASPRAHSATKAHG
jgi:hypothetical protein